MSWLVRFPTSATPLQVAIAGVDAARLAALDVPVDRLWNPWTCPAKVLPYLAWALSVDVWDDDWTEERKRKVIAAAPAVHRLKGTLGAVKRSLDAFELDASIVEWWQDDGRHGTFRVDIAYSNGGPGFDPTTQAQALQAVKAAKPKSRVMTARAILSAAGPLYVGALALSSITAVAHPFVFEPPVLRASNYVGATAATFISATARYAVNLVGWGDEEGGSLADDAFDRFGFMDE